jgi:S1-C subfamily serine protease
MSGTAFTIDVDGRQYLVTAKHVVPDSSSASSLNVFQSGSWVPLPVSFVGATADDEDITVLAAAQQLTDPTLPVSPTMDGLIYGQDVFFLGFPYDISPNLLFGGGGFPTPYVRKAIVAGTDRESLILDGHNNPGFSGGPVCFLRPNERDVRIAAVISAFQAVPEPVYDQKGNPTMLSYLYNTGLVVAHNIQHAIEIIESNPIGFQL